MSLRGAVLGTKMLKLNIVIVILLISIGTVHAMRHDEESCSSFGNIWVLHAGDDLNNTFNLGEDVYLGGSGFDKGTYSFKILDGFGGQVGDGSVTADKNGNIYDEIWNNIPSDTNPGGYSVEVRKKECSGGCCRGVATAHFTIIADPTTEIPEYPTVMIPAIMAFGGYMVIRSRRKGK